MGENDVVPHRILEANQLEKVLYALLISGIIFVVCPLFIVSNNLAEIDAFQLGASANISGILFLFGFVSFFLLVQIKALRPVLFAVLLFVSLTAFLFPLNTSSAMVDPKDQAVPISHLIISLIAASGVGFLSMRSDLIRKLALSFVLVMTFVTLVTSFLAIKERTNQKEVDSESRVSESSASGKFTTLSNTRNIIMMSFDGVPHDIMTKLLEEKPKFSSTFKDFTYFPNTFSQGPATTVSEAGVIYGIQDFKKLADTETDLRAKILDTDVYKNTYLTHVKDVVKIHPLSPGERPRYFVVKENFAAAEKHSNLFLINNSFSRIFSRFFYKTQIPKLVKSTLGQHNSGEFAANSTKHKGAEWDFKNLNDINRYDYFVDTLKTSENSEFAVRYYHSVFSHFPIDFDNRCAYRSSDEEWHKSNQNVKGLENQTLCVLEKMENLIIKLKELGIYDKTLIVLKSDHGEPAYFFDTYPDNVTFNRHKMHGYNRYKPFMMIKDYSVQQDSPTYDDRKVLINDLAKTLCIASEVENIDCNLHGGLDLFSDEENLSEPYYVYIVKDRKASWRFKSLMSVKVPNRQVDLLEFLDNHPDVKVQK